MEEVIERINELLKRSSKIGIADSAEAVYLIYKLYSSNKDYEMLVNYLYEFHYKISAIFTKKYYFEISKEERDNIIESFLNCKKFHDNQSGTSLLRGFSILTEIISKDITDNNILKIIKRLCKLAEKNSGFNHTSCKALLSFLNVVDGKFFDIDLAQLSDCEIRSLYRYVSSTISDINTCPYGSKVQAWLERYSFALPNQNFAAKDKRAEVGFATNKIEKLAIQPTITEPVESTAKAEADSLKELIRTLKAANEEAQKLFNSIFIKNAILQNLEDKLNFKEKETISLKGEIENKNAHISVLNDELNKIKTEFSDKDHLIIDLTERLKTSFNADDISKKQELITLKNDIGSAIRLQYEDFNEHKNESCNEDNYEAFKVTLNQVFRTLKRYGIEI